MAWPKRRSSSPLDAGATGRFVTGPATVLGAVFSLILVVGALGVAVVFAASLAVALALAVMLTALSAAAWRVKPRPALAGRAGHAWVRYGTDRYGR